MTINYIEKGRWLHEAINEAGYSIEQRGDGNFYTSNDIAVQAIIDNYDPILKAKIDKITELKIEGLHRANLIYDSEDTVFPSISTIELLIDIDSTYTRSGAIAPRLITVNAIIATFKTARTSINAMTILADIQNYDVTTSPAW